MWIEWNNTIVHTSSRSYLPHDKFIVIFYDSCEPGATTWNQYLSVLFSIRSLFFFVTIYLAWLVIQSTGIKLSGRWRFDCDKVHCSLNGCYFSMLIHARTHNFLGSHSNSTTACDPTTFNKIVSIRFAILKLLLIFKHFYIFFIFFPFCVDMITVLYKWLNLFNWNTRNHKMKLYDSTIFFSVR